MKKQCITWATFFFFCGAILGCSDINYVKNELTNTAKPDGGIQETIPSTKTFSAEHSKVRTAVLSVLDQQGYIYEENPSTGTIKTEPSPLTGQRDSGIFGATYSAKLFIKIAKSSVTFKARFNKESNVTMGGQNLTFPEKENALRIEFFDAVDSELGK
jgi:ribosomal protein S8